MTAATTTRPIVLTPPPTTDDPVFLFIPGIGGSARTVAPVADLLPRVVTATVRPSAGPAPSITARADTIAAALDRPEQVVVVGHSLGATVGLEVARALHARRPGVVTDVVLAAQVAPHLLPRFAPSWLDDERVIGYVTGGAPLPPGLRDSPLLPTLVRQWRGEYLLLGEYRPDRTRATTAALHVWLGDDDPSTERADGWSGYTSGPTTVHRFPGGHDFLFADPAATARRLAPLLRGDRR